MKYRLIKEENNAPEPPYTTYVIEKRVSFLFCKWWSRDYLIDTDGYYSFNKLDDAKRLLLILNGEKQWVTKTEIKV